MLYIYMLYICYIYVIYMLYIYIYYIYNNIYIIYIYVLYHLLSKLGSLKRCQMMPSLTLTWSFHKGKLETFPTKFPTPNTLMTCGEQENTETQLPNKCPRIWGLVLKNHVAKKTQGYLMQIAMQIAE